MKITPVRAVLAASVILALGLTACASPAPESAPSVAPEGGSADTALYEAAKEEGALLWYTGQTEVQIESTIADFAELYPGIQIETVRTPGAELAQRYAAGAEPGNFPDIMTSSSVTFFDTALDEEWFTDLTSADVPSLEGYPTDKIGHDGTTAIWWMGPQVIVYNTDLVEEGNVPESYEDLIDDKFTGEILMVDPRRFPTFLDFFNVLRGEFGDDILTGLAAQEPRIVESSTPGL